MIWLPALAYAGKLAATMTPEQKAKHPDVIHPVVRPHPRTGRPVLYVGGEDSETTRMLDAHDVGIGVAAGDVNAFVNAIRAFRDDPEMRQRMGRNARKLFEARFDLPVVVERWCRLVEQVGAGDVTLNERAA